MTDRIVRLLVAGRVQGVGDRDWFKHAAHERGLAGWVRNRRDGTVEAVAPGPGEAIDELIAACWRGPPSARVADIRLAPLEEDEAELAPDGVAIRPTV